MRALLVGSLIALSASGCAPLIVLVAEGARAPREEGDRGTIALDTTVNGDTSRARDQRAPTCGRHEASADHRFAFVAPATGRYRFQVDAQYDSVLAVRDPAGAELACNDDWAGTRSSQVEVVLAGGARIEVIVDGFRGRTGSYALRATRLDAPAAQPLPVGVTVTGSTDAGVDVRTPSCGSVAGSPEATFLFVPDRSGTWTLRARTTFDGALALYAQGSALELACNDDDASTRASRIVAELQAGVAYEVVVDGYQGQRGTFELWAEPPGAESAPGTDTVIAVPQR